MDQRVHPSNSPLQTRKNYVSTLFAKLGMKQRTLWGVRSLPGL
jgi:hypothetical protein